MDSGPRRSEKTIDRESLHTSLALDWSNSPVSRGSHRCSQRMGLNPNFFSAEILEMGGFSHRISDIF